MGQKREDLEHEVEELRERLDGVVARLEAAERQLAGLPVAVDPAVPDGDPALRERFAQRLTRATEFPARPTRDSRRQRAALGRQLAGERFLGEPAPATAPDEPAPDEPAPEGAQDSGS